MPPDAMLALLPVHKRALGVAVGVTSGLLLSIVTAFHVVARPTSELLGLLSQYFYGYDVSWGGIVIGFVWGSAVGFAVGWFLALARNVLLAIMILAIRMRAEMHRTRDFLDHL